MNLPTVTISALAFAFNDRCLVVLRSFNTKRAAIQIDTIETETGGGNSCISAFDKGESMSHRATGERIGRLTVGGELMLVQSTREAPYQIIARCLVRNVAHEQLVARIRTRLGMEDVHGSKGKSIGPPQELANGIGGMAIPMLKVDANVGRYLPHNSNALERAIAGRVNMPKDCIDHLLMVDGPIGGADERYPVVGRAVLDHRAGAVDQLVLMLTVLVVDSLYLLRDNILVGLGFGGCVVGNSFGLGFPGLLGMLDIDVGDGFIDVGRINDLSLVFGKGDDSGLLLVDILVVGLSTMILYIVKANLPLLLTICSSTGSALALLGFL